jgi:hypothetical protein
MLDPDHRRSGYFRSLTAIPGTRIADSLAGAPTGRTATPEPIATTTPEQLSPAARGARFGSPTLAGRSVAASEATLALPVKAATLGLLPDDVFIGTRWDPLIPVTPRKPAPAPTPVAATPSPAAPSATPVASAAPPIRAIRPGTVGTVATATPSATPAIAAEASPSPLSSPAPEPPTVDLIGPEAPGTELAVAPATRTKGGLTVPVTVPSQPGLYRLVTTIHDGEGVAYDAETQNLIPALLIRVTAPLSATFGLPEELHSVSGELLTIRVRVANTGTVPWSQPTPIDPTTGQPMGVDNAPLLVARWVGLDDTVAAGEPAATAIVRADISPGREALLTIKLAAPTTPGRYLLLFDLQTADLMSLASIGVPPGITRVVVDQPSPGQDPRRPARGGR